MFSYVLICTSVSRVYTRSWTYLIPFSLPTIAVCRVSLYWFIYLFHIFLDSLTVSWIFNSIFTAYNCSVSCFPLLIHLLVSYVPWFMLYHIRVITRFICFISVFHSIWTISQHKFVCSRSRGLSYLARLEHDTVI